MPDEPSAELLAQYRQGNEGAASELFRRYVTRLTFLARARLAPALATRTDPEDIVLSAYRSFFVGAREGRFVLQRSGDLWRLLVTITLRKVYHEARRHSAGSRALSAEQPLEPGDIERICTSRDPSPEEAIALADELQKCLAGLDPCARRVLELRLQDESLPRIAEATGRSERTVRRILAAIEARLTNQLRTGRDEQETANE